MTFENVPAHSRQHNNMIMRMQSYTTLSHDVRYFALKQHELPRIVLTHTPNWSKLRTNIVRGDLKTTTLESILIEILMSVLYHWAACLWDSISCILNYSRRATIGRLQNHSIWITSHLSPVSLLDQATNHVARTTDVFGCVLRGRARIVHLSKDVLLACDSSSATTDNGLSGT